MSVDAKAILIGAKTPLDILYYLDGLSQVEDAVIIASKVEAEFMYVRFSWLGESRSLACFFDGNCASDYEDVYPFPACFVSLGCWGFSDAIIMSLTKHFGGFYLLNDFDGEWTRVDK